MAERVSSTPITTAEIRAYYDQTWLDYRLVWLNRANRAIHFGYWDETTHSHAESLINMNRQTAARANLKSGDRILDAGCGVGGSALWLAEQYDVRVVGITLLASQVALARRFAKERHLQERVTFDQQDFTRTSFPDSSFEVIWAQESVCHASDKRAFIREAYRLLKPGGRLVMLDGFRLKRPYSEEDERLLHSWLSGWAVPDLATPDELLAWAREVGFVDVKLENLESHVERSHRRLYRMAIMLYPIENLFHALGLRSNVQHGNMRGARDQYRALQRGLWFEGIFSARKP